MEYRLNPNEPLYSDNNVYSYISIYSPIIYSSLRALYENNRVFLNRFLGEEPAPEYLPRDQMRKFSGVDLYMYPWEDFSNKEYLIIFKIEHYSDETDVFEIYHNGDRVDTKTLLPGDDRFAIILDGCPRHRSTYLFFRNKGFNTFPWFKEIEVQII